MNATRTLYIFGSVMLLTSGYLFAVGSPIFYVTSWLWCATRIALALTIFETRTKKAAITLLISLTYAAALFLFGAIYILNPVKLIAV